MHDYYRIAEISGAARPGPARAVPAWAVVAHAMPQASSRPPAPALHLVRALQPERPLERALRDAVVSSIYSGTSEMQRNIIARWLGL